MRNPDDLAEALEGISTRLLNLEHQAELLRTVLIVKEPNTVHAAAAFQGLRKQVIAAAGERRSHLAQLTSMAVAVNRGVATEDLRGQVSEWLRQAGVVQVWSLPDGHPAHEMFEDTAGGSLEGVASVSVTEPAYVDANTGTLLRLGRATSAISEVQEDLGAKA